MNCYISKYNFYIIEDNQHYIYNTVSGSILKLSQGLYNYIKSNDRNGIIDNRKLSEKAIKYLIDNRIIYLREKEELS